MLRDEKTAEGVLESAKSDLDKELDDYFAEKDTEELEEGAEGDEAAVTADDATK